MKIYIKSALVAIVMVFSNFALSAQRTLTISTFGAPKDYPSISINIISPASGADSKLISELCQSKQGTIIDRVFARLLENGNISVYGYCSLP